MKWIFSLLSVGLFLNAHAQENTTPWKKSIFTQLFVFPKDGVASVNPQVGMEYQSSPRMMPSMHLGCLLSEHVCSVTLDMHSRSKLEEDSIFYVKYGIKNLWCVTRGVYNRWNILPNLSIGAEVKGNQFYEIGILLDIDLLKSAVFSINTGIHF